jgi:predicted AAA+ superfamily ATPase
VDKTLFIKCVVSDICKIVLLTAPRAFGKTTLMNMLKQFLLGKTDLFKNLKIFTEEGRFSFVVAVLLMLSAAWRWL